MLRPKRAAIQQGITNSQNGHEAGGAKTAAADDAAAALILAVLGRNPPRANSRRTQRTPLEGDRNRMSWRNIKLSKKRWAVTRLAVLKAADWRCEICHNYANEVDHIVPLFVMPSVNPYDARTLQALCKKCHKDKSRRERGYREDKGQKAWERFVTTLQNPRNRR